MPTNSSSLTLSASAVALSALRCSSIDSEICRPTVNTGLREVVGSWNTMAMRLPRMSRIRASSTFSRSSP